MAMALQNSRIALRDISRLPTRGAAGEIADNPPLRFPNSAGDNYMESFLTPSPDEQIIRQRGPRRCLTPNDPQVLKFDLGSLLQTPVTPTKSLGKRCSPRKRFNEALNRPFSPELSSPSKGSGNKLHAVQVQLVKRQRVQRKEPVRTDVETAVRGLSHSQLCELFGNVLTLRPELRMELAESLPLPDLTPLEDRLISLRKNISKSMPTARLTSPKDPVCFRRASIHLAVFKKECIDQGRNLLDSHQWSSVVDYVLLAWGYVSNLPNWENPSHDKIKEQCFKGLALQCMEALKKGNFDRDHTQHLRDRLAEASNVSNEIDPCLQYVIIKLK